MTKAFNIASNAAYVVAAFAVDDLAVSISLIILALGSGLFHYDKRFKWFDHFGMAAVFAATVLGPVAWYGYLVVAAACAYIADTGKATPVVAILGAVALARLDLATMLLAIGVFALAYWLWHKDDGDWWSEQNMAYHAIWHTLTAIFIVILQQ